MRTRCNTCVAGAICVLVAAVARVSAEPASWEAGIARVIPHNGKLPGTAFVVALQNGTAWLVTSAHVVQGDPAPDVEFLGKPGESSKAKVAFAQYDSSYGLRGIAILTVTDPPSLVRALAPSTGALARLDKVVVAGYPDSNNGMFTSVDPTVGSVDGAEVVVNFPTDAGFSGGPLLRNDAVAGMIFGERPNAGVAVPAALIKAYLDGKIAWAGQPPEIDLAQALSFQEFDPSNGVYSDLQANGIRFTPNGAGSMDLKGPWYQPELPNPWKVLYPYVMLNTDHNRNLLLLHPKAGAGAAVSVKNASERKL
jgi:hypothetical protein